MSSLTNRVILLVTLYLCIQAIAAQSSNTSSLDQALVPLYTMTDLFLQAVFPSGINAETIEYVLGLFPSNSSEAQELKVGELVSTVLNGYAGFATCVVIGLLLVVLMPFIGLICCCCRMCGKCGGKTHEHDPKYAKCKKIVSAGLLLVFALIVIGGMVMIFFSAMALYNVIDNGEVDRQLQQEVQQFNNTIHNTVQKDIVQQADDLIEGLVPTVNKYLHDAGNDLTTTLLSNLTHIEQPVSALASALDKVNNTLDELIDSLKIFESIRNETEANYTTAETLATQTNLSGFVTQLQVFTNTVNGLSVETTIIALETGVQSTLAKIPNLKDAYKEVNRTVAQVIEDSFNKSRADIDSKVDSATKEASDQVQAISSQISGVVSGVAVQTENVSDYLKIVADYAHYGWYACLAIGSIIAFVTLLYMCGLMFGCGERPGPDANFCNRGCGAKFILAAVGFTFIFFSLLMLFTTVLFFVGSLVSSQICWTIQNPNSTIDSFEKSNVLIPGSTLTIYSVVDAYGKCLTGHSIGSVVNGLDLPISEQSLLESIEKKLEDANISQAIDSININTGNIDFLPANLNDSLDQLKMFNDFNSSIIPNMTESVGLMKLSLNGTIALINFELTNGPTQQQTDALNKMLEIFNYSQTTGLDEMAAAANVVTGDIVVIEDAQAQLQNASVEALNAILTAQNAIQANGSDLVKRILMDHVSGLTDELSEDITNGISQLFSVQCDDLAESLQDVADVVCETVMQPWNGLWFSLGWALIMLIPCLIAAFFVTSLLRRELSYDGDYKEDFSQYVNHQTAPPRSRVKVYPSLPPRNRGYDGERIPLESRGQPYHHGDNVNRAFKDDYAHHLANSGGGRQNPSRLGYY